MAHTVKWTANHYVEKAARMLVVAQLPAARCFMRDALRVLHGGAAEVLRLSRENNRGRN
jgi:hypothetical protein